MQFNLWYRNNFLLNMKFKAAILFKLNNDLVIENLDMPLLKTGQVIVKLKKSRICGSQIGEIQGVKGSDKFFTSFTWS